MVTFTAVKVLLFFYTSQAMQHVFLLVLSPVLLSVYLGIGLVILLLGGGYVILHYARKPRKSFVPRPSDYEVQDGEWVGAEEKFPTEREFRLRAQALWKCREELSFLSAWEGQPLPQELTAEERAGVSEAEVVHRWLLRYTDHAELEAEIKTLAGRLPR